MKFLPFKTTDDVKKLQCEMQQARHQQFTLGTLGISVFGLSSWFLPKSTQGGANAVEISAFASIGLLCLFWLMLRWIRTLHTIITIMSQYLELRGASEWEGDFREFIRPNGHFDHQSQSLAVELIYLLLGMGVVFQHLLISGSIRYELSSWLDAVVVIFGVVYIFVAGQYAFGGRQNDAIKARWMEVLAKRYPTLVDDSGK